MGSSTHGTRLSRAQLVAGAALVATAVACGSTQQSQPADPGVPAAVYGAPAPPEPEPTVDAGASDPQSSTAPTANPNAPVPPPLPTGPTMHPLYGAPPPH